MRNQEQEQKQKQKKQNETSACFLAVGEVNARLANLQIDEIVQFALSYA
jgi:uncharacterized small protein (DUF1192 family)